jgi:hypothetical protein
MIAFCTDQQRRNVILQPLTKINGLDYLEVIALDKCKYQLALTFLKNATALSLTKDNILLTGDTAIEAVKVHPATSENPLTILVDLSSGGDFSPYTLTLVKNTANLAPSGFNDPPAGIDSQLNTVTFSFKAACSTPVDCQTVQCCPSNLATPPDIHYLARDFASIRQAMLDRIAVLVPTWTETHESDPGITLVEALAYAADRISYLQDAINTEAYIGTARSRISLRRHARLVDYQVNEGANARAWVCLSTTKTLTVPAQTQFFPLVPGLAASIDPVLDGYHASLLEASPGPVFESMEAITIYKEQNSMAFYTWGDDSCCLPIGTTQATLAGEFSSLKAGQVLIFEEALGPLTGDPADADPTHRWAVRLTYASTKDQAGKTLADPLNTAAKLTNIAWDAADALPFPLCIASVTSAGAPTVGVSVALGNVVPTDQGAWTEGELIGQVPPAPPAPVAGSGCNCSTVPGAAVPRPRFEPVLANQPLTFAAPYYPTVSVTSVTLTGSVAKITAVNSCVAGQVGIFSGLTGGDCVFLNGQVLTVLSTGLTASTFQVSCTDAAGGPYAQNSGTFSPLTTQQAANPPILLPPPASSFLSPDTSAATPQISVSSDDGNNWGPVEDLLSELEGTQGYYSFIPEIEWDGTAHLRFGDGTYGAAPSAGVNFTANYRTGNGSAGNVGREALAHCLIQGTGITGVRNPLAAAGGVDPESMQHIVQVAPFAFQSQMRCVTAADYGAMAATLPGVSEAQGTIRWTGSWYSAFVSIDPAVAGTDLTAEVETSLDMLRMMGTDLVVEPAVLVGISIELEICVAPSFFKADVYAALWKLLVTGDSCTSTSGLLNAANFQFGQTVYASPILAAAQQVVGVAAVTLVTFERMDSPMPANTAPPTQLFMGATEIPRCDNDPNHADHGLLVLTMDGGK